VVGVETRPGSITAIYAPFTSIANVGSPLIKSRTLLFPGVKPNLMETRIGYENRNGRPE